MDKGKLPDHFLHHSFTGRSHVAHSLPHHARLHLPLLEAIEGAWNEFVKVLLEDAPVLSGEYIIVGCE